jgi:hypothetical protein
MFMLVEQYHVPLARRAIELPADPVADSAGIEHEWLERGDERASRPIRRSTPGCPSPTDDDCGLESELRAEVHTLRPEARRPVQAIRVRREW